MEQQRRLSPPPISRRMHNKPRLGDLRPRTHLAYLLEVRRRTSTETNWDRAAIPRSTEPAATLVRGQITGHATKVPEQLNTESQSKGNLTSILLIKTARRSLRVLTMSIPTNLPMTDRSRTKRLWIGKVEVRAAKPTDVLADAKGAFVNLVTWASNIDEFKKNAELVLVKLGLSIIDIENPEPVSIRRQKADFDDEIE